MWFNFHLSLDYIELPKSKNTCFVNNLKSQLRQNLQKYLYANYYKTFAKYILVLTKIWKHSVYNTSVMSTWYGKMSHMGIFVSFILHIYFLFITYSANTTIFKIAQSLRKRSQGKAFVYVISKIFNIECCGVTYFDAFWWYCFRI